MKPRAEPAQRRAGAPFPVVGIGASAGGLAAFEAFFSGMPATADPGMAFVLVQHLAPDHKSILSELIRRYTRMDVFEVEDGMVVRPNCAYVIPPNHDMSYANGALQLLKPEQPRVRRLPIDLFFRSLAQDLGNRAIGIVLSGAGSDGTQGVRAIKGEGGLTIAQSPETAQYDAMPRSAIASGMVDDVLAPAEMPPSLIAYAARAFTATSLRVAPADTGSEAVLREILALVRAESGHDFAGYKRSTVTRRVERRMAVNQVDRLDRYRDFVRRKPEEAGALSRDMLIGVTSFFRDPRAFSALRELALAPIVARRPLDGAVRVWVPGCSTGEEAYSIAILLQEEMEGQNRFPPVQVFATDIDDRAIEQARSGSYPSSIAADVPPERLARCFVEESGGSRYRVRRHLRDMVIFSEQDVIRDPPFSKLDLVSCRNVMIYMGAGLHDEVLAKLHYALGPAGFLFLGTSETVGRNHHLFAPLDGAAKVFERRERTAASAARARPGAAGRPTRTPLGQQAPGAPTPDVGVQLRQLTERALLEDSPRAAVLITARGDILYVRGRTGQYLEPAEGKAELNIMKMARQGLRRELTTALHEAIAQGQQVTRAGLRVRGIGGGVLVDLEVRRVDPVESPGEPLYLVVLEEASPVAPPAGAPRAVTDDEAANGNVHRRVAVLERERWANEEYLRSAIEAIKTSNEELRSSSEEPQSVNEELQSTNEELETSQEELQSVNEELATINAELQTTVADLARTNNDMNNLLSGTGVATLFVDLQLRIGRFTPGVTRVLNLIPSDAGRPLGHVVSNLVGYSRLEQDVEAVLDDLVPIEIEVQNRAGAWYLMAVRPYRTLEDVIEGAVITFTDTTDMKVAQAVVQEAEGVRRLAAVVQDARDAIVVQDLDGQILVWNRAATRMFGWSEDEALAMNVRDMVAASDREAASARMVELSHGEVLAPLESEWVAKGGRIVGVWLVATALLDAAGAMYAVSTTLRERVLVRPGGGGDAPRSPGGVGNA